MHARWNYVDIDPQRFEEIDAIWRDAVESYQALIRGYFLRDGDSAHTLSVVLFADEAAMRDNTEGTSVKWCATSRGCA